MLSELGSIYQLRKGGGEGWECLSHTHPSLGESCAYKKEILNGLNPPGNMNSLHECLN